MQNSTKSAVPSTGETTSQLLRRVLADLPEDTVRVGHIVRQLRRRSFGGLLLTLAILGLLPAISVLAGLVIVVPGLQMMAGLRAPLLPRMIRQREIDTDHVRALGSRVVPWIERLERFVRPRWLVLTSPPIYALVGLSAIGLGIVMMLPLPFSNLPPAVALICLSLGLMERDGLMVAVGLLIASAALVIGVSVTYVAVESLLLFLAEAAA